MLTLLGIIEVNITLYKKRPVALFLAVLLTSSAFAEEPTDKLADDETMLVTAEQGLKQQPGVSIITEEDIQKAPS